MYRKIMPEKHELIIKNSLEVTYKKSPGNFRDHKQFVPTHIRKLMEKAKQQVITVTLDQEEDDDDIYETKPEVLTTVKKAPEPDPVPESAEITLTEFDSRMPTIT